MKMILGAVEEPGANREQSAAEESVFRVSEPDGDGNRFIIAPETVGRDGASPDDESGCFAREGA